MYKRYKQLSDGKRNSDDLSYGSLFAWRTINVDDILKQYQGKWWQIIDRLNDTADISINPDKKRRGWKTIRLFVSSTFKDMYDEREHLVKHIFPELRLWCEERKLRLIECDLRWGVPVGADQRQTLMACLSEIDRCYEDNVYPYFLSILSERYGWVPDETNMPDDVKHRYKWLPEMSVTSLEICTGAYWIHNPNALFMLRSPEFLSFVDSKLTRDIYVESDNNFTESVAALKGKIRERFSSSQVCDYKCQLVQDSGSEKTLKVIGLEKFGQQVLEHFKKTIGAQYPAINEDFKLSTVEQQKIEHATFMMQRSEVVYGREDIVNRIESYVKVDNTSPSCLVLVGYPGTGKSALVALASKLFSSIDTSIDCQVFYHFVGATPGSTNIYHFLTRLWMELLPSSEDCPPTDPNELKFSMDTVLRRASQTLASKKPASRLLILIDALNQLDSEGDAHSLTWLPRQLPPNVRVIVSTLEGACLNALRGSSMRPEEVIVTPLDADARKQVAAKMLSIYNKTLNTHQLNTLIEKADAGRPLWLSVACEELRVHGEFRTLDKKIANLPADLTGLLKLVLQRIVQENGGDLVIATLCLIQMSKLGLLEHEILGLLAMTPTLPPTSSAEHCHGDSGSGDAVHHPDTENNLSSLPMAQWATIYVGLRAFFRPAGVPGEGRIDFYHRTIGKAVNELYLTTDTSRKWWHERLAAYFERSRFIQRKADELPYHLEKLEARDRLKQCLSRKDMFDELYTDDHKLQLMAYWRFASSYEVAAEEYVRVMNDHIESEAIVEVETVVPIKLKFAHFLTDIGQYTVALDLLIDIVKLVEQERSHDSKLLCNPYLALVQLAQLEAQKYCYGSHPSYKKAKEAGYGFKDKCVEIHRKHYNCNDLHLGVVYLTCSFFEEALMEEAWPIFDKHDYKQGLAEIYYRFAKRNERNENIDVAIEYFERGLDLCKLHFGLYHMKTARCYDLYGMFYWNKYAANTQRRDWLEACLPYYEKQLEIVETILGSLHPNTVRAREDVIIVLQTLGRKDEAEALRKTQPEKLDI